MVLVVVLLLLVTVVVQQRCGGGGRRRAAAAATTTTATATKIAGDRMQVSLRASKLELAVAVVLPSTVQCPRSMCRQPTDRPTDRGDVVHSLIMQHAGATGILTPPQPLRRQSPLLRQGRFEPSVREPLLGYPLKL